MIKKFINNRGAKASAIASLVLKFSSALFALTSSILLARILGLENYGIYTFAYAIVLMLSVPTSLGLPLLLTRNISKYIVNEEWGLVKGLLYRSNQFVFSVSIIVIIIAVVSYFVWWDKYDAILTKTIWVSFILIPTLSLGGLRNGALNGMKYVLLGQLPDTFLRNLLLTIFTGFFFFKNFSLTPVEAMWLHVLAASISFIVGHYFLYKKLFPKIKKLKPRFETKNWLTEAYPFSINSGISIIRQKLATFLLATFGTMGSVAIYDVAVRGAALVSFTLDAINTGIAPHISSAHESKNQRYLQNIITKSSRVVFLLAIPVAAVFILGGEFVIEKLFGKEYIDAYWPLFILCSGQLLSSITGSVGLVLAMTGHQKYYAKINVYITILNILLSIPLIMFFDVTGAAISNAVLLIIQNIILYLFVYKKLKIETSIFGKKAQNEIT